MLYLIELFGELADQYHEIVVEGPVFDRRSAAEPHPEVWSFALDMAFEKAVERQSEVRVQVSVYQPAIVNADGTRHNASNTILQGTLVEPPRRVTSVARAKRNNICVRCGEPALGLAYHGFDRYCHPDGPGRPDCYTLTSR